MAVVPVFSSYDQDYHFLADYTKKGYKYWQNRVQGKGDIYTPRRSLRARDV